MNVTKLRRDESGALIFPVFRGSGYFATRAAALAICTEIDKLPETEPVVIDWDRIDAVSGAFAAEYMMWFLSIRRPVLNSGVGQQLRAEFDQAAGRFWRDGQ